MKKESLKKLPPLYATEELFRLAANDQPKEETVGYSVMKKRYRYDSYIRCQCLGDILHVAFFMARDLRLGCKKPVYELFINKKMSEFITWDVLRQKWRTAMLDNLTWDGCGYQKEFYISLSEEKVIEEYLDISKRVYDGISIYQNKIREDQLEARHKKETDAWDQIMEQVPALPKDWERWVNKQGLHENYIFYEYSRKDIKEGYCSWCEKMVPISGPKHNKEGVCKCCGHKIRYKARGRAGSFRTMDENVYLLQKCRDGFVLRQFLARRYYGKNGYENPTVGVCEEQRIIYDNNLHERAFYYGCYKWKEDRWISGYFTGNGYGLFSTYRGAEPGEVYKRTLSSLACAELKKTGLPEFIKLEGEIRPDCYLKTLRKSLIWNN